MTQEQFDRLTRDLSLSSRRREIAVAVLVRGCSRQETALALGLSLGTVQKSMGRLLRDLHQDTASAEADDTAQDEITALWEGIRNLNSGQQNPEYQPTGGWVDGTVQARRLTREDVAKVCRTRARERELDKAGRY